MLAQQMLRLVGRKQLAVAGTMVAVGFDLILIHHYRLSRTASVLDCHWILCHSKRANWKCSVREAIFT